jgi:glycosyltransferase involved in cell wall biosynthesis
MMRALLHGLEFEVADSGEALYRTHGDLRLTVSSTRVLTLGKLRSHVRVLEKVATHLKARGLLAGYAEPLGLEYHRLAVLGFQQGYTQIARTCLRRGDDYAGPKSVSRTWAGRLLARLLGAEAKEQLLSWLAARGVATSSRRRHLSFRARWQHRPLRKPVAQMRTEGVPLVTVVTPCYNAGAFLAETMDSVFAQDFTPLEYIVVDDGSTDDSWSVIQAEEGRVIPIRLPENRGGSYARNRGAEAARGKFIMFLDADDLIAPDTISALVETAGQAAGTLAFCRWQRLRKVNEHWRAVPAEVPLPDPKEPLSGWLTGKWAPPCALLWSREDYERTGGWDESLTLGDDGDLVMRAFLRGTRLGLSHAGQAYYRAHGSDRLSVSSSIFHRDHFRSQMRVLEKLGLELEARGRLREYREPLGIAYHRLALLGFQAHPELGAECLHRGVALAGKRAVSRTAIGRLVTQILGVERKEKVAAALADLGIMTQRRRQIRTLRGQDRPQSGRGG